jgi:uncharacterized membrane protein YraQ (UPF0718 family)
MKFTKFQVILFISYIAFIIISLVTGLDYGKEIGNQFLSFSLGLLKVLPPAFILIGLFEVWVPREVINRHMGQDSGFKGYFWAVVLAATTVGGIFVAFPVASSLYKKGAAMKIILTYLGASSACRIPMTIFEMSFLGPKFSLIRLVVSLPLIVIGAILIEKMNLNGINLDAEIEKK